MIETNIQDLSVEEIMAKIKDEVQKRKNINASSKKPGYLKTSESANINLNIPSKSTFTQKNQYEVPDFNQYHDIEFITNVYRGVLKREPDIQGMQTYLEQLRSGKRSKTEILSTIRFSKEGRDNNVKILGVKKRYLQTVIYRLPFIGYFAKSIFTLLTLPTLLRRLNKYENHFSYLYEMGNQNDLLLQDAINQKAGRSELESKAERRELESKAERGELESKAERSELESKAERSELESKAERSELESKAERSELESKAEKTELQFYLQTVNYAKEYMKLVQENIKELVNEAKIRLPEELNAEEVQQIIKEDKHYLDAMYVAFEDKFRGTIEDIKERVSVYLPYVQEARKATEEAPVLDVGCGRGEWLSLMQENDIKAIGLDINRIMVTLCKNNGFDVIEADVIEYLKVQKSNSLSVITGFHIIEHLSFNVLINLYDEALRVLKPGGIVIFETPNPENILVGAHYFYSDPTHINPLVPDTMHFVLEQRGFSKVSIKRLHKYSELYSVETENKLLKENMCNEMDYSVIGFK